MAARRKGVRLVARHRTEFEAQATTLQMIEPLTGAGEAAFQRATGIVGLPGTSILVFGGGVE